MAEKFNSATENSWDLRHLSGLDLNFRHCIASSNTCKIKRLGKITIILNTYSPTLEVLWALGLLNTILPSCSLCLIHPVADPQCSDILVYVASPSTCGTRETAIQNYFCSVSPPILATWTQPKCPHEILDTLVFKQTLDPRIAFEFPLSNHLGCTQHFRISSFKIP